MPSWPSHFLQMFAVLVIVAGPVTNYIFAFIFAALLFGSLGQPKYVFKSGLTLKQISNNFYARIKHQ